MGEDDRSHRRAEVAAALAILAIVFSSMMVGVGLAVLVSIVIGSWPALDLPVQVRLLGALLVAVGVFSIANVTRYRRTKDILDSTAVTLLKFYRRMPLEKPEGRTEQFVPVGLHRCVRNPMHFGAVCIALGFAVAVSSVALLFWGVVLTVWFWFVWIPFEEKGLDALFGEGYRDYKRRGFRCSMGLPPGFRFSSVLREASCSPSLCQRRLGAGSPEGCRRRSDLTWFGSALQAFCL